MVIIKIKNHFKEINKIIEYYYDKDNFYSNAVNFKKSSKTKLSWVKYRNAYMFGINKDSRNNYMKSARAKTYKQGLSNDEKN